MPLYSIGEQRVELLGDYHFIAPDASLVGAITLEPDANIWFKVVIRAENDKVRIGEGTNVQDGSVLHVDPGYPLTLGKRVTVGHKAMLHGCTVGDGTLVGIQAVLLNGARIGRDCLVGAGALVTQGKAFPDGVLIAGSPARVVRALRPEEFEALRYGARHYMENAQRFRSQLRQIA